MVSLLLAITQPLSNKIGLWNPLVSARRERRVGHAYVRLWVCCQSRAVQAPCLHLVVLQMLFDAGQCCSVQTDITFDISCCLLRGGSILLALPVFFVLFRLMEVATEDIMKSRIWANAGLR